MARRALECGTLCCRQRGMKLCSMRGGALPLLLHPVGLGRRAPPTLALRVRCDGMGLLRKFLLRDVTIHADGDKWADRSGSALPQGAWSSRPPEFIIPGRAGTLPLLLHPVGQGRRAPPTFALRVRCDEMRLLRKFSYACRNHSRRWRQVGGPRRVSPTTDH
jgi:hypothetical protein